MLTLRFLRRISWQLLQQTVFFLAAAIICFMATAPAPLTPPSVRNKDTGNYFLPDYGHTLVAAHRAGKDYAPENTLMAVESCLHSETPPDIIETDLQCTKDGELVMFHDLYLDDKTDSEELFGRKNVAVFSKTYDELRQLNMGETFEYDGGFPYAGLRGDDIPDDLRMTKIEDVLDMVEQEAPGRYRYIMEIKYPFPWAPKMVDKLYAILSARDMTDRVIVASYWPDVGHYIDLHYKGQLLRSANPFEIVDFYGCFLRNADLSDEEIPFMALQMPYYWRHGKTLLLASLGQSGFMDYAHRYGVSAQYYTVSRYEDMQMLCAEGADVLMTNNPERAFNAIADTKLFDEE